MYRIPYDGRQGNTINSITRAIRDTSRMPRQLQALGREVNKVLGHVYA